MTFHRLVVSAALLACFSVLLSRGVSEVNPRSRRSAIVQAVERAKPAVVNIHSERSARGPASIEELFANNPSQNRTNGMGTGIVIDPRGYIVTNQHVVEDVNVIRCRLHDGAAHIARVIARDKEHDLALLKIEPAKPLATLTIATSADLMLGETVVAIGNAYGYEHTVTVGIISALKRDVVLNKDISYKQLIQTDASINPGNSGGPLLNIDGELVGVNVAIRAGAQGISFAIPVDQMVQVVGDLLAGRRKHELTPGLFCRNRIDLLKDSPRYLEVERVLPEGPAAKAGIKNGDVILQAGGLAATTTIDFERALLDLKAGETLPLRIRRGEAELGIALKLEGVAPPPAVTVADRAWKQFGFKLASAGIELVNLSNPTLRGGMMVTEVESDSPAAKSGIRAGDILVGLHKWETISMDNVAYVLNHADLTSFYPLKFFVLRGTQLHQGTLPAPE